MRIAKNVLHAQALHNSKIPCLNDIRARYFFSFYLLTYHVMWTKPLFSLILFMQLWRKYLITLIKNCGFLSEEISQRNPNFFM